MASSPTTKRAKTDSPSSSKSQNIISQIINIAKKERNNTAIERYQGWAVISNVTDHDIWKWISDNYEANKHTLLNHGVKLAKWSSLSYDSDDENEFGVK